MTLAIEHNPSASRFEYKENNLLCHLDYKVNNKTMSIMHTWVPKELEGQGIAAALTEAAFTQAQNKGWKINPICSYTTTYFKRHPEHNALLA